MNAARWGATSGRNASRLSRMCHPISIPSIPTITPFTFILAQFEMLECEGEWQCECEYECSCDCDWRMQNELNAFAFVGHARIKSTFAYALWETKTFFTFNTFGRMVRLEFSQVCVDFLMLCSCKSTLFWHPIYIWIYLKCSPFNRDF